MPKPMTTRRAIRILNERKQFVSDRMDQDRTAGRGVRSYLKSEWLALRYVLDLLDPDRDCTQPQPSALGTVHILAFTALELQAISAAITCATNEFDQSTLSEYQSGFDAVRDLIDETTSR